MLLGRIWRSADATGILRQGRPLDFSYEVPVDRNHRQRFRVNATGIMKEAGEGIEITLRVLPSTTPTLDDVSFEPELRRYIDPRSGLVVIGGGTGHGKSTTLAAITRHHIENTGNPRKIVDLQAPIEFTYSDILTEHSESPSIIGQSEIGEGRNLKSFADGIWAALRRAPAFINVGECRDVGSTEACIEACLTGHIVNTTTHAGSVAEGLRRLAIAFPAEEQSARAFDLISSLQLFVVQRLIRTSDERGRVAVREYLVFDDNVRDRFFETPIDGWSGIVSTILKEAASGGPFVARSTAESAGRLLAAGKIKPDEARRLLPHGI
jgi:defect-in-organelle-trafficking protein DotB